MATANTEHPEIPRASEFMTEYKTRTGLNYLVIASVIGFTHGMFSLYWSWGGTWLLDTVGHDVAAAFNDRGWLLALVGIVKLVAAVIPLIATWKRWKSLGFWRTVSWAGAFVLTLWGGMNTLTASLVLWNVLPGGPSVDRPGLIGHALIWDPAFFFWGITLAAGLFLTRKSKREDVPVERSIK